MKLYHFTSKEFLKSIQLRGLTMGITPYLLNGQIHSLNRTQWLTLDPSFEQPWNRHFVPDRTEVRITVKVPRPSRPNLHTWEQLKKHLAEKVHPGFDLCGGSESWLMYLGFITPSWLRDIDFKPIIQGA